MRKCSQPTPVCKHIWSSGGWRLIGAQAGVCVYFWGLEGVWQGSFCVDGPSRLLKTYTDTNILGEKLPTGNIYLVFWILLVYMLMVPLKEKNVFSIINMESKQTHPFLLKLHWVSLINSVWSSVMSHIPMHQLELSNIWMNCQSNMIKYDQFS